MLKRFTPGNPSIGVMSDSPSCTNSGQIKSSTRSVVSATIARSHGGSGLGLAISQTLAGMLALSGVAAESMVRDVGWTMMDIGKRIERGLGLTALLRATLTTARGAETDRTVTESAPVVIVALSPMALCVARCASAARAKRPTDYATRRRSAATAILPAVSAAVAIVIENALPAESVASHVDGVAATGPDAALRPVLE